MRLLFKLTLAIALGIVAAIVPYGCFHVGRQIAAYDAELRSDHRALVRAMTEAARALATRAGADAAVQLLDAVNEEENEFRVRWQRREPSTGAALRPSGPIEHQEQLVDGEPWLVTSMPLALGDGMAGAIEVRESLLDRGAYVRSTVQRTAGMALLSVTAGVGLVGLLGWVFVGRPLRRLAGKVRRVAAGDLTGPVAARSRDEMGQLGREINNMCDRLAGSQERVARETAARLRALEQLRHAERLSTVGTLASGVAHELGTPLNVVCERARMIARGETPSSEVAADAAIIVEQSERITRIVRQLLDFARRSPPHKEALDLATLMANARSLVAPLAQRLRVRLELDAVSPLIAEVDALQMQQAVTNLVMNALQASPAGATVRLKVARRGAPEAATAESDETAAPERSSPASWAALSVVDGGAGMDDEVVHRVFEPFFTTKPLGEGTGLGLSVAYGIVREHGGRIEVASERGHGSAFTILVPLGEGP